MRILSVFAMLPGLFWFAVGAGAAEPGAPVSTDLQ